MGVTTNDIARICQVSRTTVIRALNNQGRISEETRKKILDTARELGYRPDLLARGLVKGKSSYIGVVSYEVKNQYFAQMLNAIEVQAQNRDYFVNISLHEKNRKKERELICRLVDYHVDGLILSPVNKGEEFSSFLRELDTPVVIIGNKVADDIPCVGIDEELAAYEAVERIAGKGYEQICFVCPPLAERKEGNIYSHEMRLKGVERAMASHAGMTYRLIGHFDYLKEVEEILKQKEKRTAFFCSGDVFALDILKNMRSQGFRAPRDYGIMGFDNIDFLEYLSPRLSTISNSVEQVAGRAVDLLFDQMEGKTVPMAEFVDHKMIDGETL